MQAKVQIMVLIFFFAALTVVNCQEQTLKEKFEAAKKKLGQQFDPEEQFFRSKVFEANLKEIDENNADPQSTAKFEVNKFAFLTEQQFRASYLNDNMTPKLRKSPIIFDDDELELAANTAASPVDWRTNGKVSPVRSQGSCGSCYTFSTAAALESLSLIRDNKLLDLSEQQLLDCTSLSSGYQSEGCDGGYPQEGFKFTLKNGITSETKYPYRAKLSSSCKKPTPVFKVTSIHTVNGCTSLLEAIKSRPVAVGVQAENWSSYKSGVFPKSKCGNDIDHAVLLVGVNSDHWIIKNSWGADWGENGFIRIKSGNTCGICSYPAQYAK